MCTRETFRPTWPLATTPGRARKSRADIRPWASSHPRRSGRVTHQDRARSRTARARRSASTGMAQAPAGEAGEQVLGRGQDFGHGQLAHAAVVQRADAQLAWPARDLLLK